MGDMNRLQRREMYQTLVQINRRLQAASELISDCWVGLDRLCHQIITQEHVDRQLGRLAEDMKDELDSGEDFPGDTAGV